MARNLPSPRALGDVSETVNSRCAKRAPTRRMRQRSASGIAPVLLGLILFSVLACSPPGQTPPPQGNTALPFRPPAPTTQPQRQTFSDSTLRRLADAGAIIGEGKDKDQTIFASISFRDVLIDDKISQGLARLFDSDARAGPPASVAELGRGKAFIVLQFERCGVGRRELAALNGATRLSSLFFMKTHVDDASCADLKAMPALRELDVDGSDVGDEGLRFLEKSPALNLLSARRTPVGDATLARLEDARDMRGLELAGTKVTDAGLRSVGRFAKLNRLDVSNCVITDAAMAHLAGLTNLRSLNLSGTKITDAGVSHLRALNFEVLGLHNTNTSDACLKYLSRMSHLGYLGIGGTHITRAAAGKALPNTSVDPPPQ